LLFWYQLVSYIPETAKVVEWWLVAWWLVSKIVTAGGELYVLMKCLVWCFAVYGTV